MALTLNPPSNQDVRLAHIRELLIDDPSLVEHVDERESMWNCAIFKAERWQVTQPDGNRGEQYRVALGRMSLEIPAGKIDPGEDPAVCAARELTEETGLVAERLVPIAVSSSAPGFTNEKTRIFYAEGIAQHPSRPDADEFVDVVWVPLDEMVAAVRAGIIEDAKTVVSVLFAAGLADVA